MKLQTGAIITDCADANARTRQELRFADQFGIKPSFLGVGADAVLGKGSITADVEAAGSLLDLLDVAIAAPGTSERKTVILVNVAPRGEARHKWENGTPFCFFRIGGALVVSTYAQHCLSLIRDIAGVRTVSLLDVPTVTATAIECDELNLAEAERINKTQFRSLEFLPLAARWIAEGRPVPYETRTLEDVPAISPTIWCIDSFGNAKTTLLPEAVAFEEGRQVTLATGNSATCYNRLADVPRGTIALTKGSSGYMSDRLLEIVLQRDSAAKRLDLRVGSPVLAQETTTKRC